MQSLASRSWAAWNRDKAFSQACSELLVLDIELRDFEVDFLGSQALSPPWKRGKLAKKNKLINKAAPGVCLTVVPRPGDHTLGDISGLYIITRIHLEEEAQSHFETMGWGGVACTKYDKLCQFFSSRPPLVYSRTQLRLNLLISVRN